MPSPPHTPPPAPMSSRSGDEGSGQAPRRDRPSARRRAHAVDRARRRLDRSPHRGDLRHRHPHLQLGRVGSGHDSGADDRGPRIRRQDRRGRAQCLRVRGRRDRRRRGPCRVRPLSQLPRRAAPSVSGDEGNRGQSSRSLRRLRRHPQDQRVAAHPGHRSRHSRHLRPVRERGPHRPRVPGPRRRRAHHGCRSHRAHGGGGGGACRGAQRGDHRCQPVSAGSGEADGSQQGGRHPRRRPTGRAGRSWG